MNMVYEAVLLGIKERAEDELRQTKRAPAQVFTRASALGALLPDKLHHNYIQGYVYGYGAIDDELINARTWAETTYPA